MIREAGVDGDGNRQINCEEFVKIMMSTLRTIKALRQDRQRFDTKGLVLEQ